ncbi:MAG TPA: hypothetical protein DIW20_00805 [Rhodospirillaceae bacterium]|nr:hypothetical protein [Rhodospirillaceae bacterium]
MPALPPAFQTLQASCHFLNRRIFVAAPPAATAAYIKSVRDCPEIMGNCRFGTRFAYISAGSFVRAGGTKHREKDKIL